MTIVKVDSTYGPVEFDLEVVTPYFENQDPAFVTSYLERHVPSIATRFDTIKDVVAEFKPDRSLDIGCGLAVIDVFLAKVSKVSTIRLMDGDRNIPRITGIKEGTQAWADVSIGTSVVKRNVRGRAIVYQHVADAHAAPIPVDMIISTRSWGHHYAMSTYLDLAQKSLNLGGLLIIDIRNGTTGMRELEDAGFEFYKTLPDPSKKCVRMVFVWRGTR